jgi:ABC-type cobalt transport system substrate-binding protein
MKKKLTNQEIIALMDVYLSELTHRDQLFYIQAFRYFYAVIVVILLPYIPFITPLLENNLFSIHKLVFHIGGLIMTLIFGYVLWGYAIRLKASTDTYKKTYEKLPKEYWRLAVKDLPGKNNKNLHYGKLSNVRMIYIIIITMVLALLGINILLFFTIR